MEKISDNTREKYRLRCSGVSRVTKRVNLNERQLGSRAGLVRGVAFKWSGSGPESIARAKRRRWGCKAVYRRKIRAPKMYRQPSEDSPEK